MKKLSHIVPKKPLRCLYHSLIYSYLTCAIKACGNSSKQIFPDLGDFKIGAWRLKEVQEIMQPIENLHFSLLKSSIKLSLLFEFPDTIVLVYVDIFVINSL